MTGRRLPLHALSSAKGPLPGVAPTRVPGGSIAVADTDTCELALRFGARLVSGLFARGLRPCVLLTSFDEHVELSSAQRRAFPEAVELRLLALGAPHTGSPFTGHQEDHAFWVLVGQPALLSFQSSLSVLLHGSRPVLRWPESLRALRGRCTLELGVDGFEVADALAALVSSPARPRARLD